MFEWAYDGVNSSIPRNTGPECVYYLSPKRRIIETSCMSVIIGILIYWGSKRITLPKQVPQTNYDRFGKRLLLFTMSIVFGMELAFKLTSRTFIYIFNPCHIATIMQLYLLVASPSPTVNAVFRIHLNLMNGPVLAYLFPETESRKILADRAMYYIQHALLLIIPYYLLRIGGVYNVEPLSDMSWSVFTYGWNLAYHFLFLQLMALPSQVNLNHMLCAAILDPFEGQNYRLWAALHEALLCPLLSKFIYFTSNYFLRKCPPKSVTSTLLCSDERRVCNCDNVQEMSKNVNNPKNGRTHSD